MLCNNGCLCILVIRQGTWSNCVDKSVFLQFCSIYIFWRILQQAWPATWSPWGCSTHGWCPSAAAAASRSTRLLPWCPAPRAWWRGTPPPHLTENKHKHTAHKNVLCCSFCFIFKRTSIQSGTVNMFVTLSLLKAEDHTKEAEHCQTRHISHHTRAHFNLVLSFHLSFKGCKSTHRAP